jgi:hypothetical protein
MGLLAKVILLGLALVIAFLLFGAFIRFTDPSADQRAKERDVISYCESQYIQLKNDPRMSAGALQIAYGACEKLKGDFRRKWAREP